LVSDLRWGSSDGSVPLEYCESFQLWNSDHPRSLDRLVWGGADDSVRHLLAKGGPIEDLAREAAEGLRREGSRCLDGARDSRDGASLSGAYRGLSTIESLLSVSAELYTRDTFLYRRVNKYLREYPASDRETGRNLGVYIGLLRECFCVRSSVTPIGWKRPERVYRGANFSIEDVVDYGRRPGEVIRWQNFGSSSSRLSVAVGFPGNVLFEVHLTSAVASLRDVSAFKDEDEFILSPYQWFFLRDVRWASDIGRWIIAVDEDRESASAASWLRRT
jgi:hypothetical protein